MTKFQSLTNFQHGAMNVQFLMCPEIATSLYVIIQSTAQTQYYNLNIYLNCKCNNHYTGVVSCDQTAFSVFLCGGGKGSCLVYSR